MDFIAIEGSKKSNVPMLATSIISHIIAIKNSFWRKINKQKKQEQQSYLSKNQEKTIGFALFFQK
jgi:hypothetical protein